MEILASAKFGIILSILAYLIKVLLDHAFENTKKIIYINFQQGQVERISVNRNATESEVTDSVKKFFEYEQNIFNEVMNFAAKEKFKTETGNNVNLIIDDGNRKIAIKIKDSTDFLTINDINKYLAENKGIKMILFICRKWAYDSDAMFLLQHRVKHVKLSSLVIEDFNKATQILEWDLRRQFGSVIGDA